MKEVIVPADDLVCLGKEKLQEVIRCKDCKYWLKTKKQCGYTYLLPQFDADEYCSRAERKEK